MTGNMKENNGLTVERKTEETGLMAVLSEQLRGTGAVFKFSLRHHMADTSFKIMTAAMSFALLILLPCIYWFMSANGALNFGDEPFRDPGTLGSEMEDASEELFSDSDVSEHPDLIPVDDRTEEEIIEDLKEEFVIDEETEELIDGLVGTDNWREFIVILILSLLTVLFVAISGDRISFSMVTEKSSKLIEYLLTVVKPAALVVGKTLACMVAVLVQLVCMGLALFLGWRFIQLLAGGRLNLNILLALIPGTIHVSPVGVVFAVVFFITGLVFYGLYAARIGAGVSRVEDNGDNLKVFNIMLMFCSGVAMLGARTSDTGSTMIADLIALFPMTSPFIVPALLALGKISAWIAVLSYLILAVLMIFMCVLTSSVYEALVFYRGEPLSFRKVMGRMIRNQKERKESRVRK